MDDWLWFADPRFKLRFRYPPTAPDGQIVEVEASQQNNSHRVHTHSPKSDDVYFEVQTLPELTPQQEYEQHRRHLAGRFSDLAISELSPTNIASRPAFGYAFHWSTKARNVLLIPFERTTYRIIYNPRSALNERILATVTFSTTQAM